MRRLGRLARNGGPQTQLELCLGGAEERLVDGGRVRVEGDVRGGGVGVALKDDLLVITDLEAGAELYNNRQSVSHSMRELRRACAVGRSEAAACSTGSSDKAKHTFSGRTFAPRSFSGSLSFLVWPRKSTLITMGVSSVTGALVVAAMAGR